ncbi:hypothetical protein CCM_08449 [Cordyceps militaris CM01]|uniref:AMP-activated protein kinase glycogen-binding domain-containing protein n=1 Tax=Cordyceps militaris (strain CM01) TaxID=983644 RepID=G3JRA9_CORMM|nr:uncharacterized protein CCM_08449 [Cordyceps militaris CM01]EGX88405.1 hypothetical protein CCM_08449 [Cordyceps militaris CM01]
MGSYTFKWEHPAEEVYVTGTFDNWTKSIKLDKRGDIFEKTVPLKIPSDKVYYKFVVDNNWTINESSPKEADEEGNVNNFVTSEVIAASALSTNIINTVGPGSTTATMASQQPLEKDKLVGINPLPASETGVNPINLKPGEKVPQELTAGDIHKHVKLDKESYEKSDSLVGITNPADVPAASANLIPESGLPMPQNATINTVAPGATTATLAGQVPLESKPTAINTVAPGATTAILAGQVPLESKATESTSGAEDKKKNKNKKKNEKKKQKKAAAAAANGNGHDNGNGNGNATTTDADDDQSDAAEQPKGEHSAAATAATVGGSVAAVAAAVAAGAAVAASKVSQQAAPTLDAAKSAATEAINKNLPDSAKEKLPEQAKELLGLQETAKGVPPEVKESIQEAGKSPEAAANAAAVAEEKAVESELLKEVQPVPAAAVATAKEPLVQQETAKNVPAEVKESIQEAGKSPEAAANAAAVAEKKAVESELLKEVQPAPPTEAPKAEDRSAVAAVGQATEKPAETIKAPALAPIAPVLAPITAHQAGPAENGAAKAAGGSSIPKPTEPKPNETKVTVSKPVTLTPAPQTTETKAIDATLDQSSETKSAERAIPQVAEVPKPAETIPTISKPVETKPVETKPTETKPAETKPPAQSATTTEPAANGSGLKSTVATATDKTQNTARNVDKKKSRLSTFLSKIKGKLSDKN